jgi:histidine triad (HIT) family protein|tara:strand:- start:1825 stop:2205 length:381 start_codon:yes stop_codon:yes gene_type:complete
MGEGLLNNTMYSVDDCLFCNIIKRTIPADIIYETDEIIAFNDINPEAPHHLLIIPKNHIATINNLDAKNSFIMGSMFEAAVYLAKKFGVTESGYRVVMNCNADAGQTVFHIHLHFLAGRNLTWPPG